MRTKSINHRLEKWTLPVALCAGLALSATNASAQSNPRFVPLGGAAKAALYVPDTGPAPHVAFLVTHRNSNYMTHVSTQELPKRGFMVLGMNSRFDNNESIVVWEDIALDIRAGVRYLRSQPGITKVILIGHSGGGPLQSYYQALAENGPAYCQGPNKLTQCDSTRHGGFLPSDRADGIVYMDAHPGASVNTLRSLNASVKNEDKPFANPDKKLDPFSEANGFNPQGDSVYSQEFQAAYFKAQADRMNALIDHALKIRAAQAAGTYEPTDDDSFVFYRNSARLSDFSTGVARGTLGPANLLKNDGSIVTLPVVNTVRISDPSNREGDRLSGSGNGAGVKDLTIESFLSANAVRSTNSSTGIDWCSVNSTTICAIRQIHVPVTIMAMGGHYFIRDMEELYQNGAMADKEFLVVEGATHGLAACTACSAVTGIDYSNARKNIFDHIKSWTNTPGRF